MNELISLVSNEGFLRAKVSGRVDSQNAVRFEAELFGCVVPGTKGAELDCEKLSYISSAGLRVLLKAKKTVKDLSLTNVSPEVYDILEITGFSEILTVKKAMRELDLTGCEVIGTGSNGIVYRYTDDIIVKVYRRADALEEIQRERELARKALILGINTAIPYDVVKVGNSYGSVFELLSAKSLSKLIIAEPEKTDEYIRIFADMLREIHSTEVPGDTLPSMKAVYSNYALFLKDRLDPAHAEKLLSMIEAVPESKHMIHGDYHTNNVHYANGEAILIDMDTLATGNPVFEFASIFLAYRGFNMLDTTASAKFLKLEPDTCRCIYSKLLEDYFPAADVSTLEEADRKIQVLGLTRLLRRTIRRSPENLAGIAMLTEALTALLDRVDNLLITE